MAPRPYKLVQTKGGFFGPQLCRSFGSRQARDHAAMVARREGWSIKVWTASSPPKGGSRV